MKLHQGRHLELLARCAPCEHPALLLHPHLQLAMEREHLGLWLRSSPTPPAQNKTQKQTARKPHEPGNPRTKLDPHTSPRTMRAREQPIPRRPPAPHRSRGKRRGRRGTKAPDTHEGCAAAGQAGGRPPQSAAGTGLDGGGKGEGGAGSAVPHGPRPTESGAASQPGRCVRLAVPPGRRSRAGASPRPPPPSPAGRAGRERRRRFTTGPGGREAPHAAACSAAGYIYPARSLPQRARPSQSESGARPYSDAGWPAAVRRRAES